MTGELRYVSMKATRVWHGCTNLTPIRDYMTTHRSFRRHEQVWDRVGTRYQTAQSSLGGCGVELRDYLKVLRRRWKIVLACLLLAPAAAAGVTLQMTPTYASSVRLFVSTTQSTTSDAYQGGLLSEQRAASYADLVTGPEIARAVVDRLDLKQDEASLRQQVTATVVPKTVIINVTVTDANPERAQRLVRAVATEFTALVEQLETAPGESRPPIKASILGPAVTGADPVSPSPVRNIGLGAVLGLLLGAGLAALRESLDTSIRDPELLSRVSGAPILGSVPFDPAAAKKHILSSSEQHVPMAEAFRVLRTSLQYVNVDQPHKVFVITSSVPGEGKTTTACNLAITLAQAGERVALIEGDLRRPRVADYLGLERAVGLTTVLIGRADLSEALQEWGDDGLSVLTSGVMPPDPAELLQSRAMASVLADLRRQFDVILIDAPPLLPVTDAALLTAQAEGALVVVRYGKTTREQLRGSVERLASVHGRIVGTLLNRSPKKDGSGGYYAYGYGPVTGRRRSNGEVPYRTARTTRAPRIATPVGPRADR